MWPEARSLLHIYLGPGTRELEAVSLLGDSVTRELEAVSLSGSREFNSVQGESLFGLAFTNSKS